MVLMARMLGAGWKVAGLDNDAGAMQVCVCLSVCVCVCVYVCVSISPVCVYLSCVDAVCVSRCMCVCVSGCICVCVCRLCSFASVCLSSLHVSKYVC